MVLLILAFIWKGLWDMLSRGALTKEHLFLSYQADTSNHLEGKDDSDLCWIDFREAEMIWGTYSQVWDDAKGEPYNHSNQIKQYRSLIIYLKSLDKTKRRHSPIARPRRASVLQEESWTVIVWREAGASAVTVDGRSKRLWQVTISSLYRLRGSIQALCSELAPQLLRSDLSTSDDMHFLSLRRMDTVSS